MSGKVAAEDQRESPSPFIDLTGDEPTVVNKLNIDGRCYGSSTDGGECQAMGLSFDSIEEWDEHTAKHHPVGCNAGGCDILSAYKKDNSPSSYCYKHIPDDPDAVYRWHRTNTRSVVEPPKAEGHIIEEVLPNVR